jgi:exodeoxyribonuclease VII large subunit
MRLAQAMRARLNPYRLSFERSTARLSEAKLRARVTDARVHLDRSFERLEASIRSVLDKKRLLLVADSRRLDVVSPLRVLERGYSVVINTRDGRAVNDASQIEIGDELEIRLSRGRLRARTVGRDTG